MEVTASRAGGSLHVKVVRQVAENAARTTDLWIECTGSRAPAAKVRVLSHAIAGSEQYWVRKLSGMVTLSTDDLTAGEMLVVAYEFVGELNGSSIHLTGKLSLALRDT